jgi:fibronectin type 3 domain-containing protein
MLYRGEILMRKVMTKVPRYAALLVFITIILTAPFAVGAEVMNETFSSDLSADAKVAGGEFIALPSGEEGWRATTAIEPSLEEGEPNYIEYDIQDINDITEGTIEFWIQRSREGGVSYLANGNPETYDTVFELLQPDNASSFSFMIMWDYGRNVNESAIRFSYYDWSFSGDTKPVWSDELSIGFKPAVGDRVHIAITFGERPEEDNKVYINGKLLKKKGIVRDMETGVFSTYLSKSDRLRIGIETGSKSNYPGGTSLLYRSTISSFIFNDRIMTEFGLDSFALAGKPTGLKAEFVDPEVVLTWKEAVSQDVTGYNVYRKETYEGSYVKINDVEVSDVTFADANVQDGKSYSYVVTGVNIDGDESNTSYEAKVTVISEHYRVTETSTENDPTSLSGSFKDGKITITWGVPRGITPSGYNVYRRTDEGAARFKRLNTTPVTSTSYTDEEIGAGTVYYYSVTALDADGKEGRYPSEIKVVAAIVSISSISVDPARAVRSGEEVTVTVSGTPGKTASLSIAGVVDNVEMTETSNGVYYGIFTAGDDDIENTAVTVRIGDVMKTALAVVTIDNYPPSVIIGLDIRNDWENEINIDWQPADEADFKQYNVYRSTEEITTLVGLTPKVVITNKDNSEYWDEEVIPNMVYYYAVSAVDHAGNVSDLSEAASAKVLADTSLPVVYEIEESSAGVTLRAGDVLEVSVEGESDCTASFSIGDTVTDNPLTEDSRVGMYSGSYTVKSADITSDFIVVKLVDRSDNASTYASDYKVNLDGRTQTDNTAPTIDNISENSWSIAGFSGKLVAGDMLTVELTGEPEGVAYFDIEGVVTKVKMTENDGNPGDYTGTYTVQDGDYAEDAAVTGYLADTAGNVSSITASSKFSVDTTLNIEVTPSQNIIPTDERTRVEITAKVTDLNGDEVSGHKIKFTITTTDEYTGIVGGGRYTEFKDIVGGRLRTEWRSETDAFGEASASYRAGFAAKTAVILAKDLNSGDIGVGYITSFVSASVDITLLQHSMSMRRLRKAGGGVFIQVTATPDKLTADGSSKSRIRAKVTDVRGQPVSGERIVFSISSDNGNISALDKITDSRGAAEAVYTAGKKIGTVTVTALDTTAGISGSAMIVLMSDAPAKVYISASPITLPADGRSKADISISVSDVNNNPNQGAVVEYDIIKGRGMLDTDANETDRNGEAGNGYRAGNTAGTVTIEAKVTSRVPSEQEINRAKGTIFVGDIYDEFEEAEVKEWLKKVGDVVEKGEAIVRISTEMGDFDINAKHAGTLYSIKKYEDDDFEIGETLGIIEIE